MNIPLNTTFVSLDLSQAPGWSPGASNPAPGAGTGTIEVVNPFFDEMGADTIIITVKVNDNTPDDTVINARVDLTSPTFDTVTPNFLTTTTTVEGPVPQIADLVIDKTDGVTTAIPGQTILTYTITVANAGPADVTGASVTDMFPPQLTNVTYTATAPAGPNGTATGFTASGAGDINDPAVNLPNGSSVIYVVTASILPSATGTISNTANVIPPVGIIDNGPGENMDTDDTTLTPIADLTITKSDSPDPVTAGTDLTYTMTVSNVGPSNARTLGFEDIIPANTTLVSFTPAPGWTRTDSIPMGGTGVVSAARSTLDPGPAAGDFILVVRVNPNAPIGPAAISNTAEVSTLTTDPTPGPTPGITSATATTMVDAAADLAITKDDGLTTIEAAQQVTYTIVVSNAAGPSTATGATVTDIFDPAQFSNVTYTSVATNGATGNSGDTSPISGNITDIVTLPPTSMITYTVTATVNSSFSGTLTNTAVVTAPPNVTDAPGNNSATDNNTVVTAPPGTNLNVVKTDTPDPVIAGNNITYTITVSNVGAENATGVMLTDTVPANTTLVSFTVPSGWTRNDIVANQQLRATKSGPLLPGPANAGVFTLVVRVNPSTPAGLDRISNTATATTTSPVEIDSTNNSDTESTTVQTQANLNVTKTDSPDPVIAGANLTYTITVTTAGPSDAQTVSLSDVLPAGTTFVSFAAPSGWTTNTPPVGSSGTVTANRPTLAANAPASTFTLVVAVSNALADGTIISNTANLTSPTDPTPNTATTTTTVRVPQDFGDAPASYDAAGAARHITSTSLRMGANVDAESAPQNGISATGDDNLNIDDEDGVTVPGTVLINRDAAVVVNASGAGRLDAWIDFNRNGIFEASDRIATSILLVAGPNTIPFAVPADASEGPSFARFRFSSAGGLGPNGPASDGEVEDYAVGIDSVDPGSIGVIPDPENPGFNMLSINGTAGNDTISVKQLRTHKLLVEVTMNRKRFGTFSMASFRRVVAYAAAGNDSVEVGPALSSSLRGEAGNDRLISAGGFDDLFGGPGNDTLNGNGGNDRLFGEDGNDSLNGGTGNDLMLGGTGRDTLIGGKHNDVMIGGFGVDSLKGDQGDDIVIGGTTDHDSNRVALDQIMAIWSNSKDSFGTRIFKLSGLLNDETVDDDGSRDRLEGGTQRDWYLDYLLADTIVGFNSSQDRKN
jgi:uncharacterized repeat protein (TIGR01451 family)